MKNRIVLFVIITLLFTTLRFAQNTYPQEDKDWLIASLDSSFEQSGIIGNIIDHRVYEAVPKLEHNFWWRNCEDQILYLRALTVLGSDKSYEYTKAFLDSLDNSTSEKYNNCGYKLGTKVEAIYLLYKMNDFSRVDEVFELLDKDKANDRLLPYSIQLLPYIYKNIPSHKERAKQELINAVRNSTDEYAIFSSTLDLTQAFGEEELDTMIELFKTLTVPQAKRAILQLYFTKVKDKFDLRGLLQETLPVETSSMLRLYYIKVMLRGFSTTADYKFVQDYLKNNPYDSLSTLINSELNRFISYPPKTVSTLTMLDTLTSYTKQCYGYEWLKDEAYKAELLNKITNAKTKLNTGDSLGCRTEVASFQSSVNQVHQDSVGSYPKYVSNEGYKFLYYYAKYILERLPEPVEGLPVK